MWSLSYSSCGVWPPATWFAVIGCTWPVHSYGQASTSRVPLWPRHARHRPGLVVRACLIAYIEFPFVRACVWPCFTGCLLLCLSYRCVCVLTLLLLGPLLAVRSSTVRCDVMDWLAPFASASLAGSVWPRLSTACASSVPCVIVDFLDAPVVGGFHRGLQAIGYMLATSSEHYL